LLNNPTTLKGGRMTEFLMGRHDDGWTWRLVVRLPAGCDVLARSAGRYRDEAACRSSAAEAAQVRGDRILCAQSPRGHWRWLGYGRQGEPVMESARMFGTAAECRRDADRMRQALGSRNAPQQRG
jgi:hypothetical protein